MLSGLLLLCLSVADLDPDPKLYPSFKEYFRRCDIAREEFEETYRKQIADLEIDIRGEARPDRKAKLKRIRSQTERALDELNDSKVTAYFNPTPMLHEVGAIRSATVSAVIDDHTVILSSGDRSFVVTVPSTKPLKVRQEFRSPDLWIVVATKTDDDRIRQRVKDRHFVLEPVKKAVLEHFRARYEAEKTGQPANKPEGPEALKIRQAGGT